MQSTPKTRTLVFTGLVALFVTAASAQPVYVDLKTRFDTDAVLHPDGTALTPPLEETRERIDGKSLPATFTDNSAWTAAGGRGSFLFAPLKTSSLDALAINGQTIAVPAGAYGSADLALLVAPDGYANPFSKVLFRYQDGSSTEARFGPVPEWFASPTASDHSFYNYVDSSQVRSLLSFAADWSSNEEQYIMDSRGNGNAGGVRFVDGTGYVIYVLQLPAETTDATLGINVGNNFVISLASEYFDYTVSPEAYTEVANSMKIYNNFEHRALGNLKLYEFPLKPFLTNDTKTVYLLFTDATPANGWGPYIQNINVYTGTNRIFAETLSPAVNTSQATVYAQFLTDGGSAEQPYLYDNSGSGPSNRKHRFADGNGSITYKLDLPDSVTDARLTMDLANNFVVSLNGPSGITRYAQVSPGNPNESQFLIDDGNSVLAGSARFADASAYMIYQFDLPNDTATAIAQISVGNQFVIEVASGTEGEFVKERDYVAETGTEIRDNTNLTVYEVPLTSYLASNPEKIVRIRLSDGLPSDGWGPYLTGITLVDRTETQAPPWQKVLDSQQMFGVDVRNEANKGYYTVDLSPILRTNNPNREVYVRFTDGSTADGWGPGIFWMAAYTGTISIDSDYSIMPGLKTVSGEPEGFGLTMLGRKYTLDPARSLKEIVLPDVPAEATSRPYLLGLTLNTASQPGSVTVTASRSGNNLVLAWPKAATGFVPESALGLGGPWTAVGGTVTEVGDYATLTVPITGAAQYFRLKN